MISEKFVHDNLLLNPHGSDDSFIGFQYLGCNRNPFRKVINHKRNYFLTILQAKLTLTFFLANTSNHLIRNFFVSKRTIKHQCENATESLSKVSIDEKEDSKIFYDVS